MHFLCGRLVINTWWSLRSLQQLSFRFFMIVLKVCHLLWYVAAWWRLRSARYVDPSRGGRSTVQECCGQTHHVQFLCKFTVACSIYNTNNMTQVNAIPTVILLQKSSYWSIFSHTFPTEQCSFFCLLWTYTQGYKETAKGHATYSRQLLKMGWDNTEILLHPPLCIPKLWSISWWHVTVCIGIQLVMMLCAYIMEADSCVSYKEARRACMFPYLEDEIQKRPIICTKNKRKWWRLYLGDSREQSPHI